MNVPSKKRIQLSREKHLLCNLDEFDEGNSRPGLGIILLGTSTKSTVHNQINSKQKEASKQALFAFVCFFLLAAIDHKLLSANESSPHSSRFCCSSISSAQDSFIQERTHRRSKQEHGPTPHCRCCPPGGGGHPAAALFFHKWSINPSQIFFDSQHCYGLINLKPIVPGTVLLFCEEW